MSIPATSEFAFRSRLDGDVGCYNVPPVVRPHVGAPVAGSDVCHTILQNTGSEDVRVTSARFGVTLTEHEYTIQGRCDPVAVSICFGSNVMATRLIAECFD